jgi:hypothetical protein
LSLPTEKLENALSVAEADMESGEGVLLDFFNDTYLDARLNECYSSRDFGPWTENLKCAFEAHKRAEYILSIPVWLIAIEGLTKSKSASNPDFRVFTCRITLEQYMEEASEFLLGDIPNSSETVAEILYTMGRRIDDLEQSTVVSRNAILHGANPDYGKRKESVQCILLLHAIHSLTIELENEDDHSGSLEVPLTESPVSANG